MEPLIGQPSNCRLLNLPANTRLRVEVRGSRKHSSLLRFGKNLCCKMFHSTIHRYGKAKIDCLSFVMCPLLVQLIIGFFFLFFLLRPFTVLMKQTRQAVRAIKQSIFLDVYGTSPCFIAITS
jgi:hypothetical protein